jgi:hypothetical protein
MLKLDSRLSESGNLKFNFGEDCKGSSSKILSIGFLISTLIVGKIGSSSRSAQ